MIKDEIDNKAVTIAWFTKLRDLCCAAFEDIEHNYAAANNLTLKYFQRRSWERPGGGGGEISIMHGNIFEKVGVNISTVFGELSPEFRKQIPGTDENPNFFATGISIVSHMCSPLVPAAHFNTRFITTTKSWFGGGGDLTPVYPNDEDTTSFHQAFKNACDAYNPNYYPEFKIKCDEYFYLKHRQEARGVGGVFYDYLNSGDFNQDFAFTQDIGKAFLDIYPEIVKRNMHLVWDEQQREYQLYKRGRYVEFNLLYDRGTKFGLMTGGNVEAILMSLPPLVKW